MIKGKYSFFVYLHFFIFAGFFFLTIYLFTHPELFKKSNWSAKDSAIAVSLILLLLTIFGFYSIAKLIYVIKIKDKIIFIKGLFINKTLHPDDIKSIDLFSKEDFYWSVGETTIGTRIELETGRRIVITDPFYKNIDEIKRALQENFNEKISRRNEQELQHSTRSIWESDYEKLSGNPHTSFNGLIIYAFAIFRLWIPTSLFFNFKSAPRYKKSFFTLSK